jgi:hypothetical protein
LNDGSGKTNYLGTIDRGFTVYRAPTGLWNGCCFKKREYIVKNGMTDDFKFRMTFCATVTAVMLMNGEVELNFLADGK